MRRRRPPSEGEAATATPTARERRLLPVVVERTLELVQRPQTRAECQPGGWHVARPCPFVGCPHHLYLNVDRSNGAITVNRPDLQPWELTESCELDVVERNRGREAQLDEIGACFDLGREGVRRVVTRGLLKLRLSSPTVERLGAYVVPDELAPEVVEEFEADQVDEEALTNKRIERALGSNPDENDKVVAALTGATQPRVAEVRNRLGRPAVTGVGKKS